MSDTPLFGPDDDVDEIESLLRDIEPSDLEITAPPSDVWDGIEAALDADATTTATTTTTTTITTTIAADNVVPLGTRFRTAILAAAAAVALIAVGAVVLSSIGGDGDTVLASATLVHEADFDPLGADASATAQLIEQDGGFEIRLDDASLPDPAANDLELWLIAVGDDGALDVQPVSLVDPTSPSTYAVPDGLDPDVYSIVDISIEPRDGDEAHSGRSILRGSLADV